jgi:hypothetical protein
MTHDIEADFDTLLRQALMTTDNYMREACERIDNLFGDGFAKNNTALVVAFMQVASADFNSAMLKLAAQDLRDGLIARKQF